jgi:nucleotide-binding universal stress UspA family protein
LSRMDSRAGIRSTRWSGVDGLEPQPGTRSCGPSGPGFLSASGLATVPVMTSPVLLCTDGSHHALQALSAGLELIGRNHDLVLVTVMDTPEEASLVGGGHAGPDMTPEEFDDQVVRVREAADYAIEEAQSELLLVGAKVYVLSGHPGEEICQLATELSARAIVLGSRGRGGLTRLLLGSISDHVVRHAPCSVVVTKS